MSSIPLFNRPRSGTPNGGWSMTPGYNGPLFPNDGVFNVSGNNMGGWNYSVNNPAIGAINDAAQKARDDAERQAQGPVIRPWSPPGAPAAAPVGAPLSPPGNTNQPFNAPHTLNLSAHGASPAFTPPPNPTTQNAPAAYAPPAPQNFAGGSPVNNIVNQIVGSPYKPVDAPDLGITDQAQKNLIDYNQWLWNQANSNNDLRYRQAASLVAGQGTTALSDIDTDTQNQKATNAQSMIDRGLNNSTVGMAMDMGVDRNAQYNKQRVSEGQSQQLINLLQSRTDAAPDNNLFSQFLASAANKPTAQSIQLGQQPFNPFFGNIMGGGGGGTGVIYAGQGIGPTITYGQQQPAPNLNSYYPGVWPTYNQKAR
jgi:hypothetical protein